jgi:hypothetical protein
MNSRRVLLTSALLIALFIGIVAIAGGDARAAQSGPAASSRSPGDVSFLTGPNDGAPLDIVQDYIDANRSALGLSAADLADLVVTDQYTDADTQTTHIYLRQRHNGIEVFNGNISAHVARDGAIINLYSDFVSGLAGAVNTTSAAVSPEAAAEAAAAALELSPSAPFTLLEAPSGADSRLLLSDGGVSTMDIPGRLVYLGESAAKPGQSGLRLAWELHIETLDFQHYWIIFVDAASGELLDRMDLVIHDYFGEIDGHGHSEVSAGEGATVSAGVSRQGESAPDSYEVFAMPSEYPDDGPRVIVTDPAHPVASPFGWHDTDGAPGPEFTITQGNNVSAYQDQDANGTPNPGEQPDGGPTLDFTGALVPLDLTQDPLVYKNAAVVNLFYWNNIIHDVFYMHGFNEVSGNFQVNNYGNGGLGNDDVRAEAQDGGGTNNANFLTPVDGSRPRMQMYLWTLTTPRRDGDLENSIIVHEYGHGISNRLTGGPSNVSCLGNQEQPGEGWSDWVALALTAKASDTATTSRGIGTYVLGQPTNGVGIRPAPYTTDFALNDYTYGDLPPLAVPHGVGFVWATMTWDMYWELVDDHGFNPDFYGDWTTGGNNLAIRLVLDGMKLQPCSPGFVDARDAILLADQNLTGGQNQCAIWNAFARRGLGVSADQGSANNADDGVEAFDTPAFCSFLGVNPPSQDICAGSDAVYNVTLGEAFTPPVSMSAAGHPAGTTATFNPNPVITVPGATDLTIGNTAGAATGSYTVTITGTDALVSSTIDVGLGVWDGTPGTSSLVSPPDGAIDVPFRPDFAWTAAGNAQGYLVEVATDMAMTNVVYSATVETNSHTAASSLMANSLYYWRVTPQNPCGAGLPTAAWSFTTQASSFICNGAIVDFEGGIPGDWTVINNVPGNPVEWSNIAGCQEAGNWATGNGDAACASSDLQGGGAGMYNTELWSPPIDLTGVGQITLDYWANYANFAGVDFLNLDISTDGGTNWTTLLSWNEDHHPSGMRVAPGENVNLDLTAYAGNSNVLLRWHYFDPGTSTAQDWYAQVDEIALSCTSGPSIALNKTVGTDPNICATTDNIYVPVGSDVTYCYEVTNTGTVTFTLHDLDDSELGPILSGYNYDLEPQQSVFVTETVSLITNTVNTAEWTAYNVGPTDVVTATDTATVNVIQSSAFPVCEGFEGGVLPNFFYVETIDNPPASGRVQVTTAFPHSGSFGLDIDTDCGGVACSNNTQQAAIMVVDLAGQSNVLLDFWVFEHGDENHPEDGVFISDDGGATWALIQSLNNFPASYQNVVIDLDAAVANAGMSYVDGFQIKFQSLDNFEIATDGYSFDDICVQEALPAIELVKTVGTDPNVCAATDTIEVTPGTEVTYCYEVTNTGYVDLNLHDLDDSELGNIFTALPFALTTGSSTFVTATATINVTTTNTAEWTAYNVGPTDVVTATDTATVNIITRPILSSTRPACPAPNSPASRTPSR